MSAEINKPTTDQMFRLVESGALLAYDQGRLRSGDESVHFFVPKYIEGYDLSPHDGVVYSWMRRFVGRIATSGRRSGNVLVVDTYSLQDEVYGLNDGVRTDYLFSWQEEEVVSALKKVKPFNCIEPNSHRVYHDGQAQGKPGAKAANQPEGIYAHKDGEYLFGAMEKRRPERQPLSAECLPSKKPWPVELEIAAGSLENVTQNDCDNLIKDIESFASMSMLAHFRQFGIMTVEKHPLLDASLMGLLDEGKVEEEARAFARLT